MNDDGPSAPTAEQEDSKDAALRMVDQVCTTGIQLRRIAASKQPLAVQAGRGAEPIHVCTFNLDAAERRSPARAVCDLDEDAKAFGLTKNGPVDVRATDGRDTADAQLKYYATAERTSREQRRLNPDGTYAYDGMQPVGPSDQLDGIRAQAQRDRLKEEGPFGRPGVARAAGYVERNATDRISLAGIESAPLSSHASKEIIKDPEGPTRRAIDEPYLEREFTNQHSRAIEEGRPLEPGNLSRHPVYTRLAKENGVADEDGHITWVWTSEDPELTIEDLDGLEKDLDRIEGIEARAREAARKTSK